MLRAEIKRTFYKEVEVDVDKFLTLYDSELQDFMASDDEPTENDIQEFIKESLWEMSKDNYLDSTCVYTLYTDEDIEVDVDAYEK